MRKRENIDIEERARKNALRNEAMEERARLKREAEEALKKKVSVDYNLFTHICKSGMLSDVLPSGRVDITFTSIDIRTLCEGGILEKQYYGQVYQFLVFNVSREDQVEILKRSPLFQQLAESL